MPVKLKSLTIAPPGYFQFTIPQVSPKVYRSPLFPELRKQFMEIAKNNPQLGLPSDKEGATKWLEEENAMRICEIGGNFIDWTAQTPAPHIRREQPCYMAAGGRFGDLMIILPGLKHVFDTTGVKPVVVASSRFLTIMDGVSYVDAWPIYGLNHTDSGNLRVVNQMARHHFDKVIVPKWWEVDGLPMPSFIMDDLGDTWKDRVPENERNTYMTHQWRSCGWTMQELLDWPLVFDRRNLGREAILALPLDPTCPTILFNFTGISSPFSDGWKILKRLADSVSSNPLGKNIDYVDLSAFEAVRIYDLLGLFDRALCLITIDTATFHLSAASNVPTIHLQRDGHGGSLPRGNSVARIQYGQVENQLKKIETVVLDLLSEWKSTSS
jgi:hypothetical protein